MPQEEKQQELVCWLMDGYTVLLRKAERSANVCMYADMSKRVEKTEMTHSKSFIIFITW